MSVKQMMNKKVSVKTILKKAAPTGGGVGGYLSTRSEMFSDGGKKLSKKEVIAFLDISKNSNFKYWIKDSDGYSTYAYKGQLRANDSTSGIFKATKIGVDSLKDDILYKLNEEELYDWEKELDPDIKRYGWELIVDKFDDVYFLDGSKSNAYKEGEISSDQVKAEEYLWQFDRYSTYPSTLSWKDAEEKFKKSLTKEQLGSIKISYKKEKYADAEEHDTEKYHRQIFIKREENKGGSMETGGGVNYSFDYQMLGRLQSDCDYYLGHGNRSERNLWAGSVDDQIKEMKRLWNKVPIKPEWLSMEDILEYEKKMNVGTGGVKPKAVFQEKDNEGNFIGDKIFYYETTSPNWWAVSVGKELNSIPKYGFDNGQFKSRSQYPTIEALAEYHKHDSIYLADKGMSVGGRFTQGEVKTKGQHNVNSIIMEVASDLASTLTEKECEKRGIKCLTFSGDEEASTYTDEAQDIFNDFYDDKMDEVYAIANTIKGKVTYEGLLEAAKENKSKMARGGRTDWAWVYEIPINIWDDYYGKKDETHAYVEEWEKIKPKDKSLILHKLLRIIKDSGKFKHIKFSIETRKEDSKDPQLYINNMSHSDRGKLVDYLKYLARERDTDMKYKGTEFKIYSES